MIVAGSAVVAFHAHLEGCHTCAGNDRPCPKGRRLLVRLVAERARDKTPACPIQQALFEGIPRVRCLVCSGEWWAAGCPVCQNTGRVAVH